MIIKREVEVGHHVIWKEYVKEYEIWKKMIELKFGPKRDDIRKVTPANNASVRSSCVFLQPKRKKQRLNQEQNI